MMPLDDSGSPHIFSVTELTRTVKRLLEDELPFLKVEGEISNFIRHSSGHMYFSLKDADAQISCVMWRGKNSNLLFRPEDGMKVIASGRVTVYERQGRYQLDVDTIRAAGRGELQAAFEELKYKLNAEGLFDPAHKQEIPRFPRSVGVVTSATGAAIRDIVSVAERRFPAVTLILRPVPVQGVDAGLEIARAISEFNEYGDVDVLIVGRGGGSIEDLWAFNEETVARAIFASRIPVVSAVGHEIDFSISDFVADRRAATPSAAAELIVPDRDELVSALNYIKERVSRTVIERITMMKGRIQSIRQSYAIRRPAGRMNELRLQLDELSRSLQTAAVKRVDSAKSRCEVQSRALSALSPHNVLNRGYSITSNPATGKVVTDTAELALEDRINTRFARGKVESRVTEIKGEGIVE